MVLSLVQNVGGVTTSRLTDREGGMILNINQRLNQGKKKALNPMNRENNVTPIRKADRFILVRGTMGREESMSVRRL